VAESRVSEPNTLAAESSVLASSAAVRQAAWRGRRVFVTGATGIVGSWLVQQLLDAGADVTALIVDLDPRSELARSKTLEDVRIVFGRLEDYDTLDRTLSLYEIEDVFHLGAQTLVEVALRSPLLTFEANVRGTYNLLEACRRAGHVQRLVIASSDKAYGDSKELPYSEEMRLEGRHPYDVSKSCTDLLSRCYFETYDLPVVIARCGNIYGGGDLNWSRIVPGTIRSLLRDQLPQLRSNGSGTRDYIFVDDVVEAYLQLAETLAALPNRVAGEAFNFSYGEPLTPFDVVRLLQEVMDAPIREPEVLDIARAEITHQHLDSTKAREVLAWSPKHVLRDGLALTADWYRDYFQE
jgi:CDP-glucose 4,6-dehydratase